MTDIDDLKRLSPEDRIRRLKEIEKKKKKELEEAKKLMDDSVEEVIEEDKQRAKIPIQQLKADDVSIIHNGQEAQMFETKRYTTNKTTEDEDTVEETVEDLPEIESLEEAVEKEHPDAAPKSGGAYNTLMNDLKEDYNRLKSYQDLSQQYELTGEQKVAVGEITGRLSYAQSYADKATDASDNYKPMGKALAEVASAGMRIAKEVAGDYIKEMRDDYDAPHPH